MNLMGLFLRRRAGRFAAQVLNPIAAVPLCMVLSGLVRLRHCPATGAITFVTAPELRGLLIAAPRCNGCNAPSFAYERSATAKAFSGAYTVTVL